MVLQEGKELLPRCDLCGMHMLLGRLIKQQRIQRYNRNTQIWWQRRNVAIASQCAEAYFSLNG